MKTAEIEIIETRARCPYCDVYDWSEYHSDGDVVTCYDCNRKFIVKWPKTELLEGER